jgi:hypothetical protein
VQNTAQIGDRGSYKVGNNAFSPPSSPHTTIGAQDLEHQCRKYGFDPRDPVQLAWFAGLTSAQRKSLRTRAVKSVNAVDFTSARVTDIEADEQPWNDKDTWLQHSRPIRNK